MPDIDRDASENAVAELSVEQFAARWRDRLPALFQNDLLDERAFHRFARDRGLGVVQGDVQRLYARGWIRADAVREDGSPYFHPFRIYPLYWVLQGCRLNVAATSSINRATFVDFLKKVVEKHLPTIDVVTDTARLMNEAVTVPLLLEPLYWPEIAGQTVQRGFAREEEYAGLFKEFRAEVEEFVCGLDVEEWEQDHQRLRFHSASLDGNGGLYLLLRMAPWQKRERLKGHVSAALWIRPCF